MSTRAPARNNVLAGLFLVISLLLAVLIAFQLADAGRWFERLDRYVVWFEVGEGASGLKPGSVVHLGGQQMGRVLSIEPSFAEGPAGTAVPNGIDVEIGLHRAGTRRVALFEDAKVYLEEALLGTMSSLNIASVGGGGEVGGEVGSEVAGGGGGGGVGDAGAMAAATLLDPAGNNRLKGAVAPALLSQLGLDGATVRSIAHNADVSFARAREVVESVAEVAEKIKPEVEPTLEQVREAVDHFNNLATRVDTESVDIIAGVRTFVDNAQPVPGQATAALDTWREAGASVSEVVEENRPVIRDIAEQARQVVERFRTETLDEFTALAQRGGTAADDVGRAGRDLSAFIGVVQPDLRRTSANLRLASDQAVLIVDEVKAAPWRLLLKPGDKRLGEELVYNAARTYARAVSDLRAASETLDQSLERSLADPRQMRPEELAAMHAQLDRAFAVYREAERELLRRFAPSISPAEVDDPSLRTAE